MVRMLPSRTQALPGPAPGGLSGITTVVWHALRAGGEPGLPVAGLLVARLPVTDAGGVLPQAATAVAARRATLATGRPRAARPKAVTFVLRPGGVAARMPMPHGMPPVFRSAAVATGIRRGTCPASSGGRHGTFPSTPWIRQL